MSTALQFPVPKVSSKPEVLPKHSTFIYSSEITVMTLASF